MGSYVPNTKEQRQEMLKEIGFQTIDDLFAHIPAEVKIQGGLNIPEGKTELEVRRDMENIAAKNQVFKTIFRGAGAYRHFIPATVKSVISKENLLTAYTPYQAEISQGILQSIFEYQTMICDLTGMDISNACVYDGAEASAEGVAMCRDRKRSKALVSATVNPYVLETIKTYCFGNEMEIEVIPEKDGLTDIEYLKEHVDAQTACVLIQHPNYYGNLEEAAEIGWRRTATWTFYCIRRTISWIYGCNTEDDEKSSGTYRWTDRRPQWKERLCTYSSGKRTAYPS